MSIQFPSSSTQAAAALAATNISLATAQPLGAQQMSANSQGFTYTSGGTLSAAAGANYFQVTAPALPAPGAELLTGIAASTDSNAPNPSLTRYDANSNPVQTTVITNGGGTFTVQLPGPTAGAAYYVGVSPLPTPTPNA